MIENGSISVVYIGLAVVAYLQRKFLGSLYDFIKVRVSFGYWLYTCTLRFVDFPVFDSIIDSANLVASKKLLYFIHQVHRKYNLASSSPYLLGHSSSLNRSTSVSAGCMRVKYLQVGLLRLDKTYHLDLDETARQARVREVIKDKYLGSLFDDNIDILIAYLTTICLVATTGCVFTDAVYRTCINTLQKSITSLEFDGSYFSDKQINQMILVSSCLLPSEKLGEEFFRAVTDYFKHCTTNKPSDISTICYTTLLRKLGEFNDESSI
jgi:hypothetical protein